MTVLQVQSLPVLANQHRQTSFSQFFFTRVIFCWGRCNAMLSGGVNAETCTCAFKIHVDFDGSSLCVFLRLKNGETSGRAGSSFFHRRTLSPVHDCECRVRVIRRRFSTYSQSLATIAHRESRTKAQHIYKRYLNPTVSQSVTSS